MDSGSRYSGFCSSIGKRDRFADDFDVMIGNIKGAAVGLFNFMDVITVVNSGIGLIEPSCGGDVEIAIVPFVDTNIAVVVVKNSLAVIFDLIEGRFEYRPNERNTLENGWNV